MRKTLLFLLLLCTKLTFAQLNDNFSDGDFTNNPVWGGNTASFIVNSNGQLQSQGPTSGTSNIALSTTNSLALNAVWEFYFKLEFNPTATTQLRVYLTSNQADLTGSLNGYFFQIGETGNNDGFHLYKQTGTTVTQIITGTAKTWASTSLTSARIKVTRDNTGKWQLYADMAGGTNYALEGEVTDNTYTTSSYFGVNPRYNTTSRAGLYYFDDFSITDLVPDLTPPKITKVQSVDAKTIEVTFDEALNATSAQAVANYAVSNGIGTPATATIGSTNNVVNLTYVNDFTTGDYTLIVNNVADTKGNAITAPITKQFMYIEPYTAQKGDIVINEIMAAPISTAVALNKEYIELYNTSDKYIIITGWKYKDGTTSVTTLGADTLAPKAYRILCAVADVSLYKPYGKTLGVSPWPGLNNDKDDLALMLPDGTTIIDAVSYADTWYGDNSKKTGYALELINPNSPCGGAFNWTASSGANNGTPGAQNSVYNPQHIDNVAPKLIGATILSTTEVQVDFNKAINIAMLTDVDNYSINNGIGKPITVTLNGTNGTSVILTLAEAIEPNKESLLTVSNMANCAGVPIDPLANTALILIPGNIAVNDILISEVLFNPKMGGVDFVEVYNNTNKILDLKELTISNPTATSKTKREISAISVFIRPKTYWVLTANPDNVKQNYEVKNPSQMVQVASMPSFNNDKGRVALWKDDLSIDSLDYTEKMHHVLLKEVKGVSLERVSFAKSGNEPSNLQSAAASVGFATPTYKNSQSEDTSVKNSVTIVNKTFSPDNDGFEDQLQIDYRFKENGHLATINIYTDKGILVRRLARNITMSTQGTITWDGLNDGGQLCKVGLYVVKIDTFHINGNSDSFKQTCVLASKLN